MKLSPAEYVIKMFNGIRPLARILKKSPSTVCYWVHRKSKKSGLRGSIPTSCHVKILFEADKRNIDITPKDLIFGRELNSKN